MEKKRGGQKGEKLKEKKRKEKQMNFFVRWGAMKLFFFFFIVLFYEYLIVVELFQLENSLYIFLTILSITPFDFNHFFSSPHLGDSTKLFLSRCEIIFQLMFRNLINAFRQFKGICFD